MIKVSQAKFKQISVVSLLIIVITVISFHTITIINQRNANPRETNMSVSELVQKLISSNKVVIFSKSYCPYCRRAKEIFSQLQQQPYTMELDKHEQGAEIQAYLLELTKQRTVPNVFINGKHIGGCDATEALNEKGELKKMIG